MSRPQRHSSSPRQGLRSAGKHGGRASSSSLTGSADVLEALGVAIELGPAGVPNDALKKSGSGSVSCTSATIRQCGHAAPVRRSSVSRRSLTFSAHSRNPRRALRDRWSESAIH